MLEGEETEKKLQKALLDLLNEKGHDEAVGMVERRIAEGRWKTLVKFRTPMWTVFLDDEQADAEAVIQLLHGEALQREAAVLWHLACTGYSNTHRHLVKRIGQEPGFWLDLQRFQKADWMNLYLIDEENAEILHSLLHPGEQPGFSNPLDPKTASSIAFQRPFQGSVVALNQAICDSFQKWQAKPAEWKAPYLPFVQSSGTGKTRAVYQLSVEEGRWVVYVNFSKKSPFPHASSKVLLDKLLAQDGFDWAKFFSVLVAVVKTHRFRELPEKPQDLAEYFRQLKKESKDCLNGDISDIGDDLIGKGDPKLFFSKLAFDETFDENFWRVVLEICEETDLEIFPKFSCWNFHKFGPLVVVFDHASSLLGEHQPVSPFGEMFRAAYRHPELGVFIVGVDSNLDICEPPFKQPHSLHREQSSFQPFVWPVLNFMNCMLENDRLPKYLREACQPSHLLRLGRPYWCNNVLGYPFSEPDRVVGLASSRLGFEDDSVIDFSKVIRLFGPRIPLICSEKSILKTLACDYLQVFTSLSFANGTPDMVTTYPPEPALVSACYKRMAEDKILGNSLLKFAEMMKVSMCQVYEFGSFLAEMVLLLAWDYLSARSLSERTFSALFTPRSVGEFLSSFISKDDFDKVTSECATKAWLKSIFDGKMMLTHFVKCCKIFEDNPEKVIGLIRRGAGAWFSAQQPENSSKFTDLVVPFVFDPEKELLDESSSSPNMSCMLLSVVKPGLENSMVRLNEAVFAWRDICSISDDRPMVSILFQPKCDNEAAKVTCFAQNETKSLNIFIRGFDALPIFSRFDLPETLGALRVCSEIL